MKILLKNQNMEEVLDQTFRQILVQLPILEVFAQLLMKSHVVLIGSLRQGATLTAPTPKAATLSGEMFSAR